MSKQQKSKSKKSVLAAIASTALAASLACGLGAAPAVAAPVASDMTTSSVAPQAPATTAPAAPAAAAAAESPVMTPAPTPKPADPAAPASTPAVPTTPADGSVSHSGKGTSIWFYNTTDAPIKVGDTVVPKGGHIHLSGKNGDGDDVATTVSDETGKQIKLYGHNPRMKEAYLQFEGTKVYETSLIKSGGMNFKVTWSGDDGAYKNWRVHMVNTAGYDYEFVHRTDSEDGTKGTVVNKASRTAIVHLGGTDYKLAPGQSLLFFDAHQFESGPFSINKGIEMSIYGGEMSPQWPYKVKMWDTLASYPQATVGKDGTYDRDHSFAENTSRSYHWGNWRALNLDITREADGRMEVVQETDETEDWAHFTVTITDSAKQ